LYGSLWGINVVTKGGGFWGPPKGVSHTKGDCPLCEKRILAKNRCYASRPPFVGGPFCSLFCFLRTTLSERVRKRGAVCRGKLRGEGAKIEGKSNTHNDGRICGCGENIRGGKE